MDNSLLLPMGISAFILYFIWRKFNWRNLPPGPTGIPFLGNMFQLDTQRPHHTLSKWAKEYGDIYLIRLLGQDKIVLSGEEILHEAILANTEAFANRPFIVRINDIFLKGAFTITFSKVSQRWIKVKKAVMKSLKAYGSGLARIEELTHEAADRLLEKIDSYKEEAFDPQDIIQETFVKIIFSLIYGRMLTKVEAGKVIHHERERTRVTATGGQGLEFEVMPWLKYFRRSYVREMEMICEDSQRVHGPAIQTCMSESGENENTVVHTLMNHNKLANVEDQLSDLDLIATVRDLAIAGMTTSSSALYSFIALCVNHPIITERIQTEIDSVIGSRLPKLDDRHNMPYINAAILELLRIISHLPTSLPHETTQEVKIGGYTLPKGQEVWLNLWSLHHDERYWDDPWVYKPERFLTPEGELVPTNHIHRRRLMAFGAGRRVCLGETLARSRLFIIICLLLQRYQLLPEDDDNRPISDPYLFTAAFVLRPDKYKIRFVPRRASSN